mmetsp:Transcript_44069/g.52908  ORF Transcript_44069/g.52908 Transcript_44069/m.52908 type:complete len:114 (-) Transcript_44069:256-597(-)
MFGESDDSAHSSQTDSAASTTSATVTEEENKFAPPTPTTPTTSRCTPFTKPSIIPSLPNPLSSTPRTIREHTNLAILSRFEIHNLYFCSNSNITQNENQSKNMQLMFLQRSSL